MRTASHSLTHSLSRGPPPSRLNPRSGGDRLPRGAAGPAPDPRGRRGNSSAGHSKNQKNSQVFTGTEVKMAEGEVFVLLRMRCESQGDAIEGQGLAWEKPER